jgi:hypothetical protein
MSNVSKIVLLFVLISFPFLGRASTACSGFFEDFNHKNEKLETQSQNGKPRYFSVRNYNHFKGGELDKYLKNIKNLTQFSEKLDTTSTFIPDRTTIPSEAFFVANNMIPLIEDFLVAHDVNYRIETYELHDITKIKRSLIVILEQGKSELNVLAHDIGLHQRTLLVINPIDLFYGYEHYNDSRGKAFDIDPFTPGYSMSFYLLLHSVRKDFSYKNILETDSELVDMRNENILASSKVPGGENSEAQKAQEKVDEDFKESRKKAEQRLNKIIEKAIGRKISK